MLFDKSKTIPEALFLKHHGQAAQVGDVFIPDVGGLAQVTYRRWRGSDMATFS